MEETPPAKRAKITSDLHNSASAINFTTDLSSEPKSFSTGQDQLEMTRLKINNLPFLNNSQMRKLLLDKGIKLISSKKSPTQSFGFVDVLRGDLDDTLDKLKSFRYKNRDITLELTDHVFSQSDKENLIGKEEVEESAPEWERLNDKVTPLWRMTYPEQLVLKEKSMGKVVRSYFQQLKAISKQDHKSQDLEAITICPSPLEAINYYRNKCEFSFGRDSRGLKQTGFMLGLYKNGEVGVGEPSKCLNVAQSHLTIASIMQEYIVGSDLDVYDRVKQTGFWRLLMVRSGYRSGELMVVIQTMSHPKGEENLFALQKDVVNHLVTMPSSTNFDLKSILWQVHDGCNNGISDKAPILSVFGDGFIHETLFLEEDVNDNPTCLTFRISPQSFFQSSTLACEKLYKIAADWALQNTVGQKVVVLDLCCGTGTIGISMAHLDRVSKIYGIEIVKEAIDDAILNASRNNLIVGENGKLEYICDPVEKALPELVKKFQGSDKDQEVVAILDPPRSGVHKHVTQALRNCHLVNKIIYISCNPKAASTNWIELTRPEDSKFKGTPFQLVKYQPVDMFPHTEHCEMILEFRR